MKKLIFIFIMTLFSGCSDLDLEPLNSASSGSVFANSDNLPIALFGVYDAMQSDAGNAQGPFGIWPNMDGITDNAKIDPKVQGLESFSEGDADASSGEVLDFLFQNSYVVIARANELLANIDISGSLTEDQRNAIESEAKFLRALAYFRLVYLYGDVPLIVEPIGTKAALEVTRTSRDEVVAFILDEFQDAATGLEATTFANAATQQATLGMRAKVLLYEARLGNSTYAEALTAITNVISICEGAGQGLVDITDPTTNLLGAIDDYMALFDSSNENNKEVIFAIKHNATNDDGTELQGMHNISPGGQMFLSLYQEFVDDYYTTDGLPITDAASIYDSANPFENRDIRLYANVYIPGAPNAQTAVYSFDPGRVFTDYSMRKWSSENVADNNPAPHDNIILRFADLLLMLAEADNEVNNGPSAAAYAAINRIRERVGMAALAPGLDQDAFREEVRHERRIELCFEDQRWFDIVQWNIAEAKINAIGDERGFVVGKSELFPIPASEIASNPNLAPNNPGY